MGHVIEFQGRLARSDGRDVAAGRFDLRFRLHIHREGPAYVWEELHPGVRVGVGGGYSVLLGGFDPLEAQHFVEVRWLGVSVERDGVASEVGERVQLAGATVRLSEIVIGLLARVDAAEARTPRALDPEAGGDSEARPRIVRLHRRLKRVEAGGGVVAPLESRIRELEGRLVKLDDEERGRVLRLEDELDDLVGRDGELVDLAERVEALERGHGGPMRLERADAELLARAERAEARLLLVQARVDGLQKAVDLLVGQAAKPAVAPPLPEVLPGPLTVQRGGVHVAGGGLVVHDIEGRLAGASRREGTLLINSRAGGDVLVGNKETGSVAATVALRAARAPGVSRTLAVRLLGEGLLPGDVVVLDPRKRAPTVRRAAPGDAPLGVVVERAGVELGDGPVVVALAGLVRVRVSGVVEAGASLEAGEEGVARMGPGLSVGRALHGAGADSGTVEILLHR